MKHYRAAAYMRLSVANSKETQSDSIENQESIINYFLGNHPEILLVSRQVDDGYSGVIFERPGFAAMMEDVENGKIDCIIVKDLSRFGREYIETGRYLCEILPSYGVRFIAILDQIDTDKTPAKDDFVLHIKTVINDDFSCDISMRTRDAMKTMRKSGLYVGACPIYGYLKSLEVRNQLVIDNAAAVVVQEIFRYKIEGFSAAKIADMLNAAGVLSPLAYKRLLALPRPSGGFADRENPRWSPTTVFRILKDETYTGTLVQGKQYTPNYKIKKQFVRPKSEWIRIEGTHEPIVTQNDFNTVQRLLHLDTRASPGEAKVSLFSGLLVCGNCGRPMTRKTNTCNGTIYTYYYCPAGKKLCAFPVMIREDKLTERVFEQVNNYVDRLMQFRDQLLALENEVAVNQLLIRGYATRLEELHQALGQAFLFKSTLYSSQIRGIITAEDYDEMSDGYEEEIATLEKEIEFLNLEMRNIITHKQGWIQWIEELCGRAHTNRIDRAVIVQLVKRILVRGKEDCEVDFLCETMQLQYPARFTMKDSRKNKTFEEISSIIQM